MPNCPNCSNDVKPTDRFCPNCGEELIPEKDNSEVVDVEIVTDNKQETPINGTNAIKKNWTKIFKPINKKTFKAIIALTAIALLAFAVFTFTKPPGPEDVATDFLKYMKAGEYASAYDLLEITDDKLLTKDNFVMSMQALEKKGNKITDYRIEETVTPEPVISKEDIPIESSKVIAEDNSSKQLETEYRSYSLTLAEENKAQFVTSMKLTNVSQSSRAKWKVVMEEYYDTFTLSLPYITDDMTVSVNGGADYSVKNYMTSPESDEDTLAFNVFTGFNCDMTIRGANIKPITVTFDKHDKAIDEFQISDKLKTQAQEIITGFNQSDIKATESRSMTPYEPYVLKDSSYWESLENNIDNMIFFNTKYTSALDKIDFTDTVLTGMDTIDIKCVETWSRQKIDLDDGSVIDEYKSKTHTGVYKLQKQKDNKWMIVNAY